MSIKVLFSVVLLTLSFSQIAHSENFIDFNSNHNLKAVYDAGLRPWRAGDSTAHLDDVNISILLPDSKSFLFPTEMVDFEILAQNELSSADFNSQVTSTDEAVKMITDICIALNIPPSGLDHAVPTFENRGSKQNHWSVRTRKGDAKIQITLDLLELIDHLEAKIYISIRWDQHGKPMRFLEGPFQQPPGYETVSMDPPALSGSKSRNLHSHEEYKAMIDSYKRADPSAATTMGTSLFLPSKVTSAISPLRRHDVPVKKSDIFWFWLYGGIIVCIAMAIGVFLFKRN